MSDEKAPGLAKRLQQFNDWRIRQGAVVACNAMHRSQERRQVLP